MKAVNCQYKPAVAPPLDVVRDGIEGRSAGEVVGCRGVCSTSRRTAAHPSIQAASAWDVLCGEGDLLTDAREWVKDIEDNPGFRSSNIAVSGSTA